MVYVCGGEGTIKQVRQALMAKGMDRKSVKWEKFWWGSGHETRRVLIAPCGLAADRALTTGAFAALAREPGIGRAEALRRSQLVLAGEAETAQPFFWAPSSSWATAAPPGREGAPLPCPGERA